MTWLPIESAPKDGSLFLTYSPDGVYNQGIDLAEYDSQNAIFCKHGCGWQYVTHWQPLPPPPVSRD